MKYLRDFVWSTTENSNGLPVQKKKRGGGSYDIVNKQYLPIIDRSGFWPHGIIHNPTTYRF